MRARFYETAQHFLVAADRFLYWDPLSTNVVGVVAARVAAGAEPASDAPLGDSGGRRRNGARSGHVHTAPRSVVSLAMPIEAVAVLASALADAGRPCRASTVPSAPPLRSPMLWPSAPGRPRACWK